MCTRTRHQSCGDIPWQQQIIPTARVHHARTTAGFRAAAPVQIAPHRPPDRAAGILSDDQLSMHPGTVALLGIEPDRYTERDKAPIDSEAPPGCQHHLLRADRTVSGDLAEENIGRVFAP